jgi:hypothetical protein
MRTHFKAPLIALSALALLSGCKSSPAKSGYLRVVDGYAVQFIQWTQEGQQVKGTVEMLERNETEPLSVMFEGVLDGERFSITTKDGKPMEKITGRLKGDTLTLFVQKETEPLDSSKCAQS